MLRLNIGIVTAAAFHALKATACPNLPGSAYGSWSWIFLFDPRHGRYWTFDFGLYRFVNRSWIILVVAVRLDDLSILVIRHMMISHEALYRPPTE